MSFKIHVCVFLTDVLVDSTGFSTCISLLNVVFLTAVGLWVLKKLLHIHFLSPVQRLRLLQFYRKHLSPE